MPEQPFCIKRTERDAGEISPRRARSLSIRSSHHLSEHDDGRRELGGRASAGGNEPHEPQRRRAMGEQLELL